MRALCTFSRLEFSAWIPAGLLGYWRKSGTEHESQQAGWKGRVEMLEDPRMCGGGGGSRLGLATADLQLRMWCYRNDAWAKQKIIENCEETIFGSTFSNALPGR